MSTTSIQRLLRLLAEATDEQLGKQLAAARTASEHQYQAKKDSAAALALQNQNTYGELRPYEILYILLTNITPEEFANIIHRAAGHIPPAPEPKERPTNAELADAVMKTLRGGRGRVWNGHKQ